MYTETFPGQVRASTFTGSGSGLTGVPRSSVVAGTANSVIVNGPDGLLTSELQLANSRGGTGIDTSALTGLAKIAAGTWSVSQLVNADVDNAAAITRDKMAAGTAGNVLINGPTGLISAEAQLAASRGGLGADFSGIGAGPFVVSCSSGAFGATVPYAQAATANAMVQRDATGSATVATMNATTQVTTPAVASNADLTFSTVNGLIGFGANTLTRTPTAIPGGLSRTFITNIATLNATPTTLITIPTTSGVHGTAHLIRGNIALGSALVEMGTITFVADCKNTLTVLTASFLRKSSALSAALATCDVTLAISGESLLVNVTGIAAEVAWIGEVTVLSQTF